MLSVFCFYFLKFPLSLILLALYNFLPSFVLVNLGGATENKIAICVIFIIKESWVLLSV